MVDTAIFLGGRERRRRKATQIARLTKQRNTPTEQAVDLQHLISTPPGSRAMVRFFYTFDYTGCIAEVPRDKTPAAQKKPP
jgi:hypothetical protein